MRAGVALLLKILAHCDAPAIRRGNMANWHLLGEFNAWKGKVAFDEACAWHTAKAIIGDGALEAPKPSLLKNQRKGHGIEIQNVFHRLVAICALPGSSDFLQRVHV